MDIFEKIRNGDYDTKLPYPKHPSKPILTSGATASEAREYADKMDEYEINKDNYHNIVHIYNVDIAKLNREFINDLEEEYEVVGNQKARLLYCIAYELGHSGGFSEIANYYATMVVLIK